MMESRSCSSPLLDPLSYTVSVSVDGSPGSVELTPSCSSNTIPSKLDGTGGDTDTLDSTGEGHRLSVQCLCSPCCDRIGTCYLVYCVACLSVTGLLLVATVAELVAPKREAHIWQRLLRPEEEVVEVVIGIAMGSEMIWALHNMGPIAFFRSRWRLLDAAVASLTLLCGVFLMFRRIARGARLVVEDIDLPILALRFALQPVRMLSTASMVVRAHKYRRKARAVAFEGLPFVFDPRVAAPAEFRSALTPAIASQLREALPGSLQYLDWHLAYAPRVHGASLKAFYRRQVGPNILVARDAHGNLFGAFASEAWRQQSGAYGTGESFIFVAHHRQEAAVSFARAGGTLSAVGAEESWGPNSTSANLRVQPEEEELELQIFPASMQNGAVIQWSGQNMFGMGQALVFHEDFLRGTSNACESFASPPLFPQEQATGTCGPVAACGPSPATARRAEGVGSAVFDFECWLVGDAESST